MAIDPICGMTVDEASALPAELDGETFYFCSELYPFFGLLLSPIIAGAAMSLSFVSVISNALRLRKVKL